MKLFGCLLVIPFGELEEVEALHINDTPTIYDFKDEMSARNNAIDSPPAPDGLYEQFFAWYLDDLR